MIENHILHKTWDYKSTRKKIKINLTEWLASDIISFLGFFSFLKFLINSLNILQGKFKFHFII